MLKGDFVNETMSDLMYDHNWLDFSEALDEANRLWDQLYGADTEEVYTEYGDVS